MPQILSAYLCNIYGDMIYKAFLLTCRFTFSKSIKEKLMEDSKPAWSITTHDGKARAKTANMFPSRTFSTHCRTTILLNNVAEIC